MIKFFKKILISFVLSCSIISHSEITDKQLKNYTEKLDKLVIKAMKQFEIPGATYVISRKNKIIHEASFGFTDFNKKKEVEDDTLFPLASLSKNVAAFLVGALVDDGVLKFEDKVRKYLPSFFLWSEEISNEMTIQDLISFGSGFKHFSGDTLFCSGYSKEKILAAFKYLKPKPGEFRTTYAYQNVIFGMVGDVIQNATGELYEDLVQKYIFDKLKMNDSSAIPLEYEESFFGYVKYRTSRFAHESKKLGFFKASIDFLKSIFSHKTKKCVSQHSKYENTVEILPKVGFFHKFPSTCGISFSAKDFGKWIAMVSGGGSYNGVQIVSPQTFKKLTSKMVEVKNIRDDDSTFPKERISRQNFNYGMGTFIANYGDNGKHEKPIIFHMGGIYGASAFFAADLKDDISIGVICNLGGVSHTQFTERIVFQFLDLCLNFSDIDWIQYEIDEKEKMQNMQMEYYTNLKDSNVAAMDKAEYYVGTYTSSIYGDVTITLENDELFLSNGIKKTKLKHVNRDMFEFPCKDMMFSYHNTKEYAMFSRSNPGNKFDSLNVSCFHEQKNQFKRK